MLEELDVHPAFSRRRSWKSGGLTGDALEAARADIAARTEERERQIWKDEAEWFFRSLDQDATPGEITERVFLFIRSNRHEYLGPLGSDLLSVQEDLFGAVDEVLIELGLEKLTEAQRVRMGIVLEEAHKNAAMHGNLRDPERIIETRLQVALGRTEADVIACVTVVDEGDGFDLASVPDPTDEDHLEMVTGRGLLLCRDMSRGMRHDPPGNTIHIWDTVGQM
ncbi:hypothetical protein A2454_00560 [Candidatus Peribacteria bacterium RIFOXYC2_FULL_55_14]|nr:MAG: hypothetical protein A2198_05220 [Candidatus Peribacteria bacterium RIFOXYA1_FULL_56_14]OGJ72967.1 MAG: hypothetical protein A2217_06730 [Candidatus Peribacteria bacterium RIFOXYA2_FULL_55_28]OGJ73956.1 MAG: hypothetical protein A2384_05000 [Candidatus Peribacteria bacterium RIFOXYB1_FULL_54_35]OGJ76133.1 MAG: hypothetical protein A2327_04470 [Candidatus Peribacteria bacterium RIFOXYB2_FULL_54_17]OGJ79593.1 MAG: hypothetical protein A2424_00955 [Candidatus Peribacteria bacterium RIFOXYC